MNLIIVAQKLAHEAHDSINQKRKYNGLPYWVHTDAVAETVQSVKGATPEMVCAAHCHDVIEDVYPKNPYYSIELIKRLFGPVVAGYVLDLTDVYTKEAYPHLNRKARHTLENERLAKTCPEVKTIKLADLSNNTESIVKEDKDFAKIYLREKFELLGLLSDGDATLLERASMQCVIGMQALGIAIPTIQK